MTQRQLDSIAQAIYGCLTDLADDVENGTGPQWAHDELEESAYQLANKLSLAFSLTRDPGDFDRADFLDSCIGNARRIEKDKASHRLCLVPGCCSTPSASREVNQ